MALRRSVFAMVAASALWGAPIVLQTVVALGAVAPAYAQDDDDDDADEATGGGGIEFDGDDDAGGAGGFGGGDDDDDFGDDDDDAFDGDDEYDLGEQAIDDLLGLQPGEYSFDDSGDLSRPQELLALDLDDDEMAIARDLGFRLIERTRLSSLGATLDRLAPPSGIDLPAALDGLSRSLPAAPFDYNHIFVLPEGIVDAAARPQSLNPLGRASTGQNVRIGVIDTLPDQTHPALQGRRLQVRDFAGKGGRDRVHATSVVSIIAGLDTRASYSGLLPAASVWAANVFDIDGKGMPSTDAARMVKALDWLAAQNVSVVNMSIAGPESAMLRAVIERLQGKGVVVVAAVGNDGPAAPAMFPAAFDGVVGVTATDLAGNVYRRAGRGEHVDFSAPGVGLRAAIDGAGYGNVTGTSFATPVVAAMIALRASSSPASRFDARSIPVRDLGASGRDRTFGAGLVVLEVAE
jgi:minor extracellular protease Epr